MLVVLDTNVLIRALAHIGVYGEVLDRIKEICHQIAYSKKIEKEYKGCATKGGMTTNILLRKLQDLEEEKKLKFVRQSLLESKLKNVEFKMKPKDATDLKFVKIALVTDARYVITTDKHLLDLKFYRNGETCLEFITPKQFLSLVNQSKNP